MIREYYEAICNGVDVRANLIALRNALKDEKEIREYKVDQLKFKPRKKKGKGGEKQAADGPDAELKQLEALEKREGKSKLDNN